MRRCDDPLRPRSLCALGVDRRSEYWGRPRFDSQAGVRSRSGAVGKDTQDTTQTGDERGQLLGGGGVEDF
jgi:hypothetical protein